MSRYYEIQGKMLPSVTTILGMLNKPALMPWAVKCTAEAVRAMVPDDEIITISRGEFNAVLDQAKKAYRAKSTEAMSKGTLVHEAIQAWLESDGRMTPDELSDPVARQGLEQFLRWGEEHDIEVLSYEQQVHMPDLYAGRYDCLANVNGKRTMIDFKTSSGIWDEYKVQVHAYAYCLDDRVDEVAVLRLDKETGDIEYVSWPYDPEIACAFVHLASAYNILFPYKEPKKGKKNGN